ARHQRCTVGKGARGRALPKELAAPLPTLRRSSASKGGRPMNMEVRQPALAQKTRLKIIDVDIHPKSSVEDLKPYLSNRWWDHVQTYGARTRQGFAKGYPYPKGQPIASRRDSWPPGGGLPGSDLNFMKQQYLDLFPIEYAIM